MSLSALADSVCSSLITIKHSQVRISSLLYLAKNLSILSAKSQCTTTKMSKIPFASRYLIWCANRGLFATGKHAKGYLSVIWDNFGGENWWRMTADALTEEATAVRRVLGLSDWHMFLFSPSAIRTTLIMQLVSSLAGEEFSWFGAVEDCDKFFV